MTRYVVIFDDNPQMKDVRSEHETDHLAFLERHRARIKIAGGLREFVGGPFVGGLWVVEADSEHDVDMLLAEDPYFRYGERKYRVLVWGKALAGDVIL